MLVYEYKLDGNKKQFQAIEEAIRTVQFIRNKCLRLWMDGERVNKNDLQIYCSTLAQEFPFAKRLNSQARQASADRAWFAISRFYENCKEKKPGKKGYPQFQHNNRSVEYKQTGWKLDDDGKHITFTNGYGIGRQWINYYGTLHDIPIIAVPPNYTSQKCSDCDTIVKKSLSVRTHICPNCGLIMDRDQNAAKNILEKALSSHRGCTGGHSETDRLAL